MPVDTQSTVRCISVRGHGNVRLKPDVVTLYVGVEEYGSDTVNPSRRAATKLEATLYALTSIGVKPQEVSSHDLSVSDIRKPLRDDVEDERLSTQIYLATRVYKVGNILAVRTELVNKVGDMLNAAMQAGCNHVQGPYYGLNNEPQARQDALEAALLDARSKADALAAVSGVRVQGLESVAEVERDDAEIEGGGGYVLSQMPGDMAQGTNTVEIKASVVATFRF